jgi:hypothetical protein
VTGEHRGSQERRCVAQTNEFGLLARHGYEEDMQGWWKTQVVRFAVRRGPAVSAVYHAKLNYLGTYPM